MATRKHLPPIEPLSPDERPQWRKAYRAALKSIIAKHNGKRMPPEGTGKLAGEHADIAIFEERLRFKGDAR